MTCKDKNIISLSNLKYYHCTKCVAMYRKKYWFEFWYSKYVAIGLWKSQCKGEKNVTTI